MVEETEREIARLEHDLKNQQNPEKRLITIDALCSLYTFTNIDKAQEALHQLNATLQHIFYPDFQLNYHWNKALVENQLYRFSQAADHFQEALKLVEERGNVEQQADLLIDFAGTCINLNDYEKTIQLLDRASRYLEQFPDERLQARICCREGVLNLHLANYTKAIEWLLEADNRIFALGTELLLKDYYFLTNIHSGLGEVYQRNGENQKSVESYLQVLGFCRKMGMRTRLSWHYLNAGRGFVSLNNIEEAIHYFKKALENSDDSSEAARAGAYANLGFCYLSQGNNQEAIQLFNKAEAIYLKDESANLTNLFNIENWRGKMYAQQEFHTRAFEHLTQAFEYARRVNNHLHLAIVCKEIANVYAHLADYKNAYEYLQLSNDMQDRYQQEWNQRTVTEFEVKYETEKKRQETEMLRLQATSLQLKALRAQMNPHFIYNALNSIQHYITSQNVTLAAKYLAKFAKLMRQSLDYSDQEIISLEKEIEFLKDYLEINQKLRFEDQMDYSLFVDDELEEDIMGVPTMIVQPYVENAIEHGLRGRKNGLVKLGFYLEDDDTIRCVVEDNGIGRARAEAFKKEASYSKNHRSKGTSITEKRLEVLHRAAKQENRSFVQIIDLEDPVTGQPKGTRVEVLIPIVDIQVNTSW